jgi:hypothetical protein
VLVEAQVLFAAPAPARRVHVFLIVVKGFYQFQLWVILQSLPIELRHVTRADNRNVHFPDALRVAAP